jgi:hypothetical protein
VLHMIVGIQKFIVNYELVKMSRCHVNDLEDQK